MTKRYVLSREDVQNLIHNSMTFFSKKSKECMDIGKIPMFSDRVKWIDEFLDGHLREFPIDKLLDEVEESFSSFTGRSFDEIKDDIRKDGFTKESVRKDQEKIKEFLSNLR